MYVRNKTVILNRCLQAILMSQHFRIPTDWNEAKKYTQIKYKLTHFLTNNIIVTVILINI